MIDVLSVMGQRMNREEQEEIYHQYEYVVNRVINRCFRTLVGDTREEAMQVGKLALWGAIPGYKEGEVSCKMNSYLQYQIEWAISRWISVDIFGINQGKYERLSRDGLLPSITSYDGITINEEGEDSSYLDYINHTTDTPEHALLRKEQREVLNAGLSTLTRKQRVALVEHVMYGTSLHDIAERDGGTFNNQRRIYFQARKRMAKFYNEAYS
jgi:RNA polymerase sigma factor (sigma-70 family)